MKRCSKCDFIYEDDQSLCDMDGSELVHESGLFPPAVTKATKTSNAPVKSLWRSFALTAVATVLLGTVLSIGFCGYTSSPAQNSSAPTRPALETDPAPVKVEPVTAPTPAHSGSPASSTAVIKEKTAASSAAKASSLRVGSSSSSEPKKSLSGRPKQEEKSKVGSLLKKTGRILKKPFKF